MIAPKMEATGSCDEGYGGILCTNCAIGYSRSGDFNCEMCPAKAANALRLIGIMILAIGVVVLMIRSTLKGAHQKRNVTSIF